MDNKFIEKLESKSIDEIIALKNDYPFATIFHMVAAKKAKEAQHEKQQEFTASASLRVPSRQVLKEYLQKNAKYVPKTQLEKVLFAPFLQTPNYTTNKVTENQPVNNVIQPISSVKEEIEALITDEGLPVEGIALEQDIEVEIYEIEEKATNLEENTLLSADIEEIEDNNIEVEIYQYEEEVELENHAVDAQSLVNVSNEEPLQDKNIDVSYHHPEHDNEIEIITEQVSEPIDLTDQNENITVEDSILNEDQLLELTINNPIETLPQEEHFEEVQVERYFEFPLDNDIQLGNDYVSELELEQDIEDDHFIEIPDEVINKSENVVKTSLYDEIAYDNNEEIGDQLILEDNNLISKNNQNSTTVEELQCEQTNSVYKQVVEILKKDQQSFKQEDSISNILLNENQPIVKMEEDTVEEFLAKAQDEQEDAEFDELDRLYQENAYALEIENEIKQMQEQNIGAGQPNNSEEKFSFINWLNTYSQEEDTQVVENNTVPASTQISENKVIEEEEKNEEPVRQAFQNQSIAKEIEYQYRDSDEDLSDETSLQVQAVAMKSMQKDTSFYTETLAVIYAMQEKYDQAIEVYEQLALINSEKSSYFADQIQKIKENLD